MRLTPRSVITLRTLALVYLLVLVGLPVGTILWQTFSPGLGQFWAWITTPAAISAFNLSMLLVAIAVPLNTVFGVITALVLVRRNFRGKGLLQAAVDLPFATWLARADDDED